MTHPEHGNVPVSVFVQMFGDLATKFPGVHDDDALHGWRSDIRLVTNSPQPALLFLEELHAQSYGEREELFSDESMRIATITREFETLAMEQGAGKYDVVRALFHGVPEEVRLELFEVMWEEGSDLSYKETGKIMREFFPTQWQEFISEE